VQERLAEAHERDGRGLGRVATVRRRGAPGFALRRGATIRVSPAASPSTTRS